MVIRTGYNNRVPIGGNDQKGIRNGIVNGIRQNQEHEHGKPMWCADQSPYPEVVVETPNKFYAQLLMEDHAGLVSETSAIMQYLYHHNVLEEDYPDVAELLECISMVEMTHMELLAEAIIKLGGKPKFGTKTTQGILWWRGDFIYYGTGICDMLVADIQGEKGAIAQYQKHIDAIDDKHIKKLLYRIINDEKEHIKYLTEKVNKYCKKK